VRRLKTLAAETPTLQVIQSYAGHLIARRATQEPVSRERRVETRMPTMAAPPLRYSSRGSCTGTVPNGLIMVRCQCPPAWPRTSEKSRRKGVVVRRRMMNGKIHRARVTGADLNYVGSISIDPKLLKAADILPNEQVAVYNLMNGARFETYAIEGADGEICLNGAAARLAQVGDLVIIVTFVDVDEGELSFHEPSVVFVDEHNSQADVA
jgi:aspartate 1-decarboxylase